MNKVTKLQTYKKGVLLLKGVSASPKGKVDSLFVRIIVQTLVAKKDMCMNARFDIRYPRILAERALALPVRECDEVSPYALPFSRILVPPAV